MHLNVSKTNHSTQSQNGQLLPLSGMHCDQVFNSFCSSLLPYHLFGLTSMLTLPRKLHFLWGKCCRILNDELYLSEDPVHMVNDLGGTRRVVPAGGCDRRHAACRERLDRGTVFRPLVTSWKGTTTAGELNDKLVVHQTNIGPGLAWGPSFLRMDGPEINPRCDQTALFKAPRWSPPFAWNRPWCVIV